MKKFAAIIATALLVAFAAPAFSATNPFMDVPMNHWAYDAIGQLAAHGILSGYPDGTYKGKQPTTRYEMASALARALAVVDMTKASKQDVEMLKRLVVEFRDELEALGVKVDELDDRVKVLESRLGGWHIHGSLVLDAVNRSANNAADRKGDGSITFDEARLFFERTWGDNDEYFFRARLRNDGALQNNNGNSAFFDRFYVEMPFFFDSRLTVGRFLWDLGTDYRLSLPQTGSWTGDSVLTDRSWTGFGLTKSFGVGKVYAYLAHPDNWIFSNEYYSGQTALDNLSPTSTFTKNWEAMLAGQFQFTEQFGFDIGIQAMIGDNAEDSVAGAPYYRTATIDGVTYWLPGASAHSFNNLWTVYGGLRFNANENIAFKGIFYHQKADTEVYGPNSTNTYLGWWDYGYGIDNGKGGFEDDANHWAVMVDVKQEALKFTSLWLEYGQYDKGFWAPQGMSTLFPSESKVMAAFVNGSQMAYDMKYYRIALGQQWTDKIATHLFYYGYTIEDAMEVTDYRTGVSRIEDAKAKEFGVGVQYQLNPYTSMGLNYIHVDNDGSSDDDKDNIIRFRTKVSF